MEKNEFLAVTQQFMSQQGFQLLKKSKFYYEAAEFVLKFELQRSNYSELYYFDFNIRIKELLSAWIMVFMTHTASDLWAAFTRKRVREWTIFQNI